MKHEPKKHFDVSKPRRRGPDPTSKPIIVGHHPTMPDPMIREEREKASKPITVISDGDEPEPLNVTTGNPELKTDEPPEIEVVKKPEVKPVEESLEVKAGQPDQKPDAAAAAPAEAVATASHIFPPTEPPPEASSEEPAQPDAVQPPFATEALPAEPATKAQADSATAVAAAADAAALPALAADQPPAPPEPPAGQELHIPAGNGTGHGDAKVRHRPRIWVWIVIGLIVFIWIYAAVDALTNTKLPLEFFENSNQTAQPVTNTPVQSAAPAQTTTPPAASSFVLPAGWTWYENKDLGFKFAYPITWGTVTVNKTASAENTTKMVFSKNKNYYIDVNDNKIVNQSNGDIRDGIQKLIRDDSGKLQIVIDGETRSLSDNTVKILSVTNETCGYWLVDLPASNNNAQTAVNVEQFAVCSLAKSSGVFILSHIQTPKETAKSIEEELTSTINSYQTI
ncbi:MAG TPA: hypothetical protein VFW52_01650 [Candidatus Saccharimonadales bacterium]|nr:hypothetical protein [Candidatus Saccharimonadales bacterium]